MKKWTPKKQQKFIVKIGEHKLELGSPFTCTGLCFNGNHSVVSVDALDAYGNERIFKTHKFIFEATDGKVTNRT